MYEIFKTAIAQMGAVGLLLSFAGIVVYWLRNDNLAKDEALKREMEKREMLLREVLSSHQDTLLAMKSLTDSLSDVIGKVLTSHKETSVTMKSLIDSLSTVVMRIEDITERIEAKIDAEQKHNR